MRSNFVDLSSDNHLQQVKMFGGFAGEHNETILQVKLPKRMIDIECSGYQFDFQTAEGNKISSPLIPVSKVFDDIVSFYLTEQLTIEGDLSFDVVAVLVNEIDKNIVSLISKTTTVVLYIKDSPKGNAILPDPKGYKDELLLMIDDRVTKALEDIDISEIDVSGLDDKFVLAKDVSNIMAKSPNHYKEKTIHKGQWWKPDGTLGTDNRYNAHEPILVPNGKVLFSTYADGIRRLNCIREGLITDVDDNIIYFESTISNWQPFINNYGQDVYVRVNIFNENHSAVYGNEIQIEVVDSVDDVAIHDYVPHPYGWYLLSDNEELTEEDTYNENIFADEITDTVNKVKSKTDAPCFAFAYVTDTHHHPNNDYAKQNTIDTFCNIKEVCDKAPLHCVINGGDVLYPSSDLFTTQEEVDNTIAEIRDRMLKANENVYFTCGNHDGIGGGHPQTSNYMSMFLHNQNKVEIGDGGTYYYFDYSAAKLRCIFLDTSKRETTTVYGISDTQYAWLENTINTTPENYKVMLFSHIPPSPSNFENGVAKYDFSTNRARTLTFLNNFNNNSGRVVGWFSGHDHFDWLPTKEYSGCDFPVIITTGSYYGSGAVMDGFTDKGAVKPTRNLRTVTQDAWNAVVYRPDEAKLYVYRFGAGDDRIIDL